MTENTDSPGSSCGPDDLGRLRRADLLLLLPFVWQLGLAPWANQVAWRPLGLPFPMVWQMAGVLFATAVLALRLGLEPRTDAEDAA